MDNEVLGQVKKERQKSRRLEVEEILQPIAENLGVDVNTIIKALGDKVRSDPKFRVMSQQHLVYVPKHGQRPDGCCEHGNGRQTTRLHGQCSAVYRSWQKSWLYPCKVFDTQPECGKSYANGWVEI